MLTFTYYLRHHVDFIDVKFACKDNKSFSKFVTINTKREIIDEIDIINVYKISSFDPNLQEKYFRILRYY